MSHQEREKIKLLQRLRKLRGQLDAVERSLEADEDWGGQLMLLAAVLFNNYIRKRFAGGRQ